jgi:hypothetical protein
VSSGLNPGTLAGQATSRSWIGKPRYRATRTGATNSTIASPRAGQPNRPVEVQLEDTGLPSWLGTIWRTLLQLWPLVAQPPLSPRTMPTPSGQAEVASHCCASLHRSEVQTKTTLITQPISGKNTLPTVSRTKAMNSW